MKKGWSVLLWGYLPEGAGGVGVDFLYMTGCVFKGKKALASWEQLLEGHWHRNFALHAFLNAKCTACFSHLVLSVALFLSFSRGTKECLRDILQNWLRHLSGLETGPNSKLHIQGGGQGRVRFRIALTFFASCDFLAPMMNFKRLI